jgi:hypothetical protein
MKKISIVFAAIFCINNLTFAQDFYAGLKAGLKVEKYNILLNKKENFIDYLAYPRIIIPKMDFSAPTLQAVFRTTFPKNWEIETGIGWYNYSQKLKAKINTDIALWVFGVRNVDVPYVLATSNEHTYGSINLSEKVGYRFKLASNLHLRLNTGLQLGILYNARSTSSTLVKSDPLELYIIYYGVQKPYINLLVSNTISLQYTLKSNVYLSIFASYHAGLFDVYNSDLYIVNRKSSESTFFYDGQDYYISSPVATKGSYFEFGIELGYVWKKKITQSYTE